MYEKLLDKAEMHGFKIRLASAKNSIAKNKMNDNPSKKGEAEVFRFGDETYDQNSFIESQ